MQTKMKLFLTSVFYTSQIYADYQQCAIFIPWQILLVFEFLLQELDN
jgi:hypothetical protein